MANRSRGRGRAVFARPPPRTKIWIGNRLSQTQPAGGAATLLATLNAAALLLRPFTILRTRIEILWRSDQTATNETPTGAYGQIVVKQTAGAIGVTAVPTPLTEIDADWYIYQGLTVATDSLTSVGFDMDMGHHWTIDSKAMRKVGVQDDDAVVVELDTAAGAFINVEGRQLIQLH